MSGKPKISLGNQIMAIEASMKDALPFRHKSTERQMHYDALQAAVRSLELLKLHADDIRALIEKKRVA